jgi:hypothetical protein
MRPDKTDRQGTADRAGIDRENRRLARVGAEKQTSAVINRKSGAAFDRAAFPNDGLHGPFDGRALIGDFDSYWKSAAQLKQAVEADPDVERYFSCLERREQKYNQSRSRGERESSLCD